MTTNLIPHTLEGLAANLAICDLQRIASEGMNENHYDKFDFEVATHSSRKEFRFLSLRMLPSSCKDSNGWCNFGIFKGLTLLEILDLCFTSGAIDFLFEHAYNPSIFWSNVNTCVFSMFRVETKALPFDLETLKSRIIGENTPFGIRTSPYSDENMARLKAHAMDGKFDPNKLEAAYAFELILHGFLLRQKLEDYKKKPSILVVNPMWAHLLDDESEAAPEDLIV